MIDKGYFTTSEVMKITGLSRCRCLQFARKNNVSEFLSPFGAKSKYYVWTDRDIEQLKSRIGKRGCKLFT